PPPLPTLMPYTTPFRSAAQPPIVIITSNRTREVHDALRRRCLYHWVEYPDFDTETRIVALKAPGIAVALRSQLIAFVHELRKQRSEEHTSELQSRENLV